MPGGPGGLVGGPGGCLVAVRPGGLAGGSGGGEVDSSVNCRETRETHLDKNCNYKVQRDANWGK